MVAVIRHFWKLIIVFRSKELIYWNDLKAKVIAILIELIPFKSTIDELADHWTTEDKLIDDLIKLGLKSVMNQSNSGKIPQKLYCILNKFFNRWVLTVSNDSVKSPK